MYTNNKVAVARRFEGFGMQLGAMDVTRIGLHGKFP